MAHIAESIALNQIWKIRTYINTRGLSVDQILEETGASWALNSIMYNQDGSPCSHLKVEGEVVGKPDYNAWGLTWDEGPDIHLAKLPNLPAGEPDLPARNYIGGVKLVMGGKADPHPIYDKAQGGVRGRTAWGLKAGRFCADIISDGSREACTPEQLGEVLEDFGWEFACMGDCGGSSQGVLNGRRIKASRRVRYLLLIWTIQDKPTPAPTTGYEPVVKSYNLLSCSSSMKLSPHFSLWEFSCGDGSPVVFVSDALLTILEAIRDHFGAKIHVTSGYRTPPYNASKKVKGSPKSQHLLGLAADIVVDGVSPREVGRYARQLMPTHGGVGIYSESGFTHVDVRKRRSDWKK